MNVADELRALWTALASTSPLPSRRRRDLAVDEEHAAQHAVLAHQVFPRADVLFLLAGRGFRAGGLPHAERAAIGTGSARLMIPAPRNACRRVFIVGILPAIPD